MLNDQSPEAHMFIQEHVLANANVLMDELIRISEKDWNLEDQSWFEDLYLQFEQSESSENYDEDDDSELRNPYEFYIVSDFFARQLKKHDQLVTDHFGFSIWGRETTGQHIILDYVFQLIWKEYNQK